MPQPAARAPAGGRRGEENAGAASSSGEVAGFDKSEPLDTDTFLGHELEKTYTSSSRSRGNSALLVRLAAHMAQRGGIHVAVAAAVPAMTAVAVAAVVEAAAEAAAVVLAVAVGRVAIVAVVAIVAAAFSFPRSWGVRPSVEFRADFIRRHFGTQSC